ncbi:MAG: T9SS type A sorting domain-containing protein [Bacteroidales bacterium]|nr:T9SS type A sorting domain-containing protein [Bacteroidales bacterium]
MKKLALTIVLFAAVFVLNAQTPWTGRTYCKITLDTKLMENPSCSLGGGGGLAATWPKVYAHLGLCTCSVSAETRNCSDATNNQSFCLSQITPFQSQVWQHVVGNWGDIADDDGVGLMQTVGNGVYSIEFIIEDYFSSADVSTEQGVTSAVPSMPWNVNLGGKPYTMGMVFRNVDGTSSGRDALCKDIFIVDILGDPKVIQGSDPEGALFPAIVLDIHDASIEEIMTLSDNTFIYPNPANENFEVKYKIVTTGSDVKISIYDTMGRLVVEQNPGKQSAGWYGAAFSTENLENGVYMVQVALDSYVAHTERLLISR